MFFLPTPGSPGVQEDTIHKGWPLTYQSLIMKMLQVLLIDQTYEDIFSIVVPCFQICQGLFQADLKKKKENSMNSCIQIQTGL